MFAGCLGASSENQEWRLLGQAYVRQWTEVKQADDDDVTYMIMTTLFRKLALCNRHLAPSIDTL